MRAKDAFLSEQPRVEMSNWNLTLSEGQMQRDQNATEPCGVCLGITQHQLVRIT